MSRRVEGESKSRKGGGSRVEEGSKSRKGGGVKSGRGRESGVSLFVNEFTLAQSCQFQS